MLEKVYNWCKWFFLVLLVYVMLLVVSMIGSGFKFVIGDYVKFFFSFVFNFVMGLIIGMVCIVFI